MTNLGQPLMITSDWETVARQVCTERQLQILQLREKHGLSWHVIALTTNLGHSTVRGHYRAAVHNIHAAMQNGHQ